MTDFIAEASDTDLADQAVLIGETAAVRSASRSNRRRPASAVANARTKAPLRPAEPTIPAAALPRADHE